MCYSLVECSLFGRGPCVFLLLEGTYPPGSKNISLWKKFFFIFFGKGSKVDLIRFWSVEGEGQITYKLSEFARRPTLSRLVEQRWEYVTMDSWTGALKL